MRTPMAQTPNPLVPLPRRGGAVTDRMQNHAADQTMFTLLDVCVSSLRRRHASLLCIDVTLRAKSRSRSDCCSSAWFWGSVELVSCTGFTIISTTLVSGIDQQSMLVLFLFRMVSLFQVNVWNVGRWNDCTLWLSLFGFDAASEQPAGATRAASRPARGRGKRREALGGAANGDFRSNHEANAYSYAYPYMFVHVHVYMCTWTGTKMYTDTDNTRTRTRACMHACMHAHMHTCMYAHMHAYVRVLRCTCAYAHARIRASAHMKTNAVRNLSRMRLRMRVLYRVRAEREVKEPLSNQSAGNEEIVYQ